MFKKSIGLILTFLILINLMAGCRTSDKSLSDISSNEELSIEESNDSNVEQSQEYSNLNSDSDSISNNTSVDINSAGSTIKVPTTTIVQESKLQGTLKVSFFLGGNGDAWFKYLKAEFEKQNPKVKIILDGDPTMNETIVSRIEGEVDIPDVMFLHLESTWQRWGAQKKIIELSDLYSRNVPGTNMTLEQYVVDSQREKYLYTLNGKVNKFVLPWTDGAQGIIYNKKMFDQNGWTFPDNWADFEILCNNIKAKGISPITYPGLYAGYNSAIIMPWIAQEMGDAKYKEFMNPTSTAIFSDQAILRAWQKYESLFKNGWVMQGTQALNHIQSQMAFLNGKSAMIINGSWLENEMKSSIPAGFEMRMAPVPSAGIVNKKAALRGMIDWVAIPTASKNQELAKEFLLFSVSPALCNKYLELSGTFRPFKYDASNAKITNFIKSINAILTDTTIYNCSINSPSPLFIDINAGNGYSTISTGKSTASEVFSKFTSAAIVEYNKRKDQLGIK